MKTILIPLSLMVGGLSAALFSQLPGREARKENGPVVRLIVETDSGPVSPDYQWHEVLTLTPDRADLVRSCPAPDSPLNPGHWSIPLDDEATRSFFSALSRIEFESFRRQNPPVPLDGGHPVSTTLERANGRLTLLRLDPGTRYPGSEALLRLIEDFVRSLPFPPQARR